MKRFVFIGSLIVFVIIGFLVFDKLFFHLIFKFKPAPGSCLILEEKYCKKGVVLPNPWDANEVMVGFNIPVGTKIFSPDEGKLTPSMIGLEKGLTEKTSSGFVLRKEMNDNVILNHIILTEIKLEERLKDTKMVNKGDEIISVGDKKIDYLGDYNLIYALNKYNDLRKEAISTRREIEKIFKINHK